MSARRKTRIDKTIRWSSSLMFFFFIVVVACPVEIEYAATRRIGQVVCRKPRCPHTDSSGCSTYSLLPLRRPNKCARPAKLLPIAHTHTHTLIYADAFSPNPQKCHCSLCFLRPFPIRMLLAVSVIKSHLPSTSVSRFQASSAGRILKVSSTRSCS